MISSIEHMHAGGGGLLRFKWAQEMEEKERGRFYCIVPIAWLGNRVRPSGSELGRISPAKSSQRFSNKKFIGSDRTFKRKQFRKISSISIDYIIIVTFNNSITKIYNNNNNN